MLENPLAHDVSRLSGRPLVKAYTPGDVYIVVVYEQVPDRIPAGAGRICCATGSTLICTHLCAI